MPNKVTTVSGTIEAVRGMHDLLPAEQQAIERVRTTLLATIGSHGYQSIDLPIIEQRDLYMRKLGEELAGKLYEFSFGGRDLVLRPEWTASVLRAYVAHLQDQPLPLRLSYAGPVFRYERPQRHTYRQFAQVGVELIGGPAPRADAEVLALACAALDTATSEESCFPGSLVLMPIPATAPPPTAISSLISFAAFLNFSFCATLAEVNDCGTNFT